MVQYKIKDLMMPNPEVIGQDRTLKDAAVTMERIDCGILPVGTPDKLIGMITDRDIVVRAIAKGKDIAKTKVNEIMTSQVFAVPEDASLDEAAEIIARQKVNRLAVKDSAGKLCGIFSLSGLCRDNADKQAIMQFVQGMARNGQKKAA